MFRHPLASRLTAQRCRSSVTRCPSALPHDTDVPTVAMTSRATPQLQWQLMKTPCRMGYHAGAPAGAACGTERPARGHGKTGNLAKVAHGDKACSDAPDGTMVQVDAHHAETHICDTQGRANTLEATALSPTTSTIPTWWAYQRHASRVAWGRLTRGDSSRIGIHTFGRGQQPIIWPIPA